MHGKDGKGRYKAFVLGSAIQWKICYLNNDELKKYSIVLLESDIKDVAISAEGDAPGEASGVTVDVHDIKRDFRSLTSETGIQELTQIFALYLTNYQDISISIGGARLDPEKAIASRDDTSLPDIKCKDGTTIPVKLEIIEWNRDSKRTLYLCSETGVPLTQLEGARFHIGEFSFSGYLKSRYVDLLQSENRLELAEMDIPLQAAINEARGACSDLWVRKPEILI